MERLLAILLTNSEWAIAIWLITPNGWLGGSRPVERLNSDPEQSVRRREMRSKRRSIR